MSVNPVVAIIDANASHHMSFFSFRKDEILRRKKLIVNQTTTKIGITPKKKSIEAEAALISHKVLRKPKEVSEVEKKVKLTSIMEQVT